MSVHTSGQKLYFAVSEPSSDTTKFKVGLLVYTNFTKLVYFSISHLVLLCNLLRCVANMAINS